MTLRPILTLLAAAVLGLARAEANPAPPVPPTLTPAEIGQVRQLLDGPQAHEGAVSKDVLQALGLDRGGPFRSFTVEPTTDLAYEISALPTGAGYLVLQAHGAGKASIRVFLVDLNFGLISAVERIPRKPVFAMPIHEAIQLYGEDLAMWRKFITTPGP